jgi:hypothetical protein
MQIILEVLIQNLTLTFHSVSIYDILKREFLFSPQRLRDRLKVSIKI